ncbi:L-lactate dehydrogenase-like [Episyrphus balteatus]|uniref:L-lactate dehydrogenase-like n=1 Tax=Episyrphus balteatus TaxID=286459 RepID=UPI002485F020|nr:L-lactate dehydrogenase-like [Episyrphus balteatus]
MSTIRDQLLSQIAEIPSFGCNKVTIVGAGHVGLACAFSILTQEISNEICLIDVDANKVKGEVLDLQHGSSFVKNAKITGGTDFAITAGSRIYIITAGVSGLPEESRLSLLERNAKIIRGIIPQIVKTSPDSIILMVTNPVDVLSYLAWKISGFPINRVFGSGTTLDSARFRFLISQRLSIAPTSCEGSIIGEHGDSSVAVWSAVNIDSINLRDYDERIGSIDNDAEGWREVHLAVINAARDILKKKGYTNWAIGLSCASIVDAIFTNSGAIMPVSTAIKGMYGIEEDIFLSMPCALHANGITSIIKLNLTPSEGELLQKSAKILNEAQKNLEI